MQIEYEAKFVNINKNEVRKKLRKVGARLIQKETLMKRLIFFPPKKIKGGWLRIRDEGKKITMSVKVCTGKKIEDHKEEMVVIDSFESGIKFVEALGAVRRSYQESKRETWKLLNAVITIDTWPGLNPLVEIEAKNEKQIKLVAKRLGFNYNEAVFGTVLGIYEKELGISEEKMNYHMPVLTFAHPPKYGNK